jgi:hypothetical protein
MSVRSIIQCLVESLPKSFFLLLVFSTIVCEVRAERRSSALSAIRLTRLRATPPTVIISKTPGGLFATYSNVMVRNVGRIEASNIRVALRFDLNVTTRLTGPQKLGPNEVGIYSSSKRLPVPRRSRHRVIVTCGNCRK